MDIKEIVDVDGRKLPVTDVGIYIWIVKVFDKISKNPVWESEKPKKLNGNDIVQNARLSEYFTQPSLAEAQKIIEFSQHGHQLQCRFGNSKER